MRIQKIYNKLVDQFQGEDDISITHKNGRIIISMKRDNKVWTKEQEKYLIDMENRIISTINSNMDDKFDKFFKLLKNHIDDAFESHVNKYHK